MIWAYPPPPHFFNADLHKSQEQPDGNPSEDGSGGIDLPGTMDFTKKL